MSNLPGHTLVGRLGGCLHQADGEKPPSRAHTFQCASRKNRSLFYTLIHLSVVQSPVGDKGSFCSISSEADFDVSSPCFLHLVWKDIEQFHCGKSTSFLYQLELLLP